MEIKQSTSSSLLKRIGALLLTGCMLTGMLAGCKNSNSDANNTTSGTTTGDQLAEPVPEIDHFVKSDDGLLYSLISPSGSLQINITTDNGIGYWVSGTENGQYVEWTRHTTMGIGVDRYPYYTAMATVTDAQYTEIERSFPLMGNQSTVEDHCYEAVFTLEQSGYTYYLDVRAYDNGVAFRYRMPNDGSSSRVLTDEMTRFSLPTDLEECWYGVNSQDFEPTIELQDPTLASSDQICMPLTAVLKDRTGYISIMEGGYSQNTCGVNLKAEGDCNYSTQFFTRTENIEGDIISGWRLINVSRDLNGLVNNYNIYCVNEPMDEELFADTTWIEPGRSAWSWNVNKQAPTYEQMLEYTEMAAELGFEYNIIDEGWHQWPDYQAKLTDIGTLGDQYGVKQMLWTQITRGSTRADATDTTEKVDALLGLLEECHLDGFKMDFWWSEALSKTTDLQTYVLTEAAKKQFVINFHGCNKNSGLNATYPNELTREAVRGHENIGFSDSGNYDTYASWLNKQLYTRFLCGHADWTPATQSAMQIGSIICIDSPFMAISYDPAKLLASPAVEFVKSIPTTWDKTVVLPESVIGLYSVYAKQKDGVWFVGGIASANEPVAQVTLADFITDEGTYTAEVLTGVGSGMKIETMQVTKDDVINIGSLNASEGFAIRLTKLSLSQYGGKINGAVTVTAPSGATVKYTTDGSDPRTSDTAVACNGSITLDESCRLKVAITDGDGKGTMLSYRFNKMD